MAAIIVRPALSGERFLLRRMLDEYLNELVQYADVDLDYPWFDAYWQPDEARWPYLLLDGSGEPAGFALINTHSPTGAPVDYSMAEFFVAPAKRSAGLGRAAVKSLLQSHPGVWELSAMQGNAASQRFWRSALASAALAELQLTERDGDTIFRFRTG
jgi:predicted acetyltransferase